MGRKYKLVDKENKEPLKDCVWDLERIQKINEGFGYRFTIEEVEENV